MKLSSDQLEFQNMIRRFLEGEVSSEYRRKRIDNRISSDDALWAKLGELGSFEYFFGDGATGTFLDLWIIAFESGRVLLPELLTDSLLGSGFLKKLEGSELSKPVLALLDRATHAAERITIAPKKGIVSFSFDGGKISTVLRFVPCADRSQLLIVPHAESIFLVDLSNKTANIDIKSTASLDESRAHFAVTLNEVEAHQVSESKCPHFERMLAVVRAGEVSGVMSRVVEMTAEYVKTRKQYDVPIGGFQAVQHKMSDMLVDSESLKSLSSFAAWAWDASPNQFDFAAEAARNYMCTVGPRCVETGVQLHGGIGFTWEYDLHFYLRRVKAIEALFGYSEEDHDQLIALAK